MELDIRERTFEGMLTVYEKQNEGRNKCPIRLSAAGSCKRQVALKASSAEERALDGRGSAIFSMGHDRGEHMAAGLKESVEADGMAARCEYSHHLVIPYSDEEELWPADLAERIQGQIEAMFGERHGVRFDDGEEGRIGVRISIRGRSDIFIVNDEKECVLGDFKTMNTFGWKRTKPNASEVGHAYLAQLGSYLVALEEEHPELKQQRPFLYIEDKNTQDSFVHHLELEELRSVVFMQVIPQYRLLLIAVGTGKQREVAPDFGPGKTGKLPWNCNYCSVAESCWRNAGLVNGAPGERIPKYSVRTEHWRDEEGSVSAGDGPRYEKPEDVGKIPTEDIEPSH